MLQEQMTGGVASALTHPVLVKVINEGPGIWGSAATGLITAGAAIAAVMLTHRFTLKREKQASEGKLQRERYFIATELVLMLEKFAADCSDVVVNGVDMEGRLFPGVSVSSPEISYSGIEGDWRAIPEKLLYRIRELPVLCANAEALIRYVQEMTGSVRGTFECRQYQYARIGLFALIIAAKLRRECGLPAPRRDADSGSVSAILWRWRRHLLAQRLRQEVLTDEI